MTKKMNPGREIDCEKELDLEKALLEGKILGGDLSKGGVPNITLNVKNLHLHFDERMDSRTFYGRNPWADDEGCGGCDDCDDCEGCDDFEEDEDCDGYGGYEEDYGCDEDPDEEESYEEDDEDEDDPFHKTFTFDEVVESVHDATGLCKTVIAEVLERHRAARKPESTVKPMPTVKPVPTADRFVRKGADYERR